MAKLGKKNKPPVVKAPAARRAVVAVRPEDYLDDLLGMRGEEAPDFAMLSSALFAQVAQRIPTGSLGIDRLIGGGWPVGRIIEVAAWEGVGKSTILDQSAAQCQRTGGIVALIDSEQARDLKYTRALGVDVDRCILADVDDIEGGFEQLDKIIAVQSAKREALGPKRISELPCLLVIWDSIGGTPAREELKGAPDDSHVSPAARAISENFRRITVQIMVNKITLVFANHFYQQIGGFGGLKTYGGKGVRYYPSIRLWLTRGDNLKIGDRIVGHQVEAKVRKTKVGSPRAPTTLGLVHMGGIDNSFTLFEWGLKAESSPGEKWIATSGAHRYLRPPGREPIHFQRGFSGLGPILNEHPDIYAEMAAGYLASPDL